MLAAHVCLSELGLSESGVFLMYAESYVCNCVIDSSNLIC